MNMETKHFAIEEMKTDDEARTIEGFGSIFGNVDSQKDIMMPGAFAKSLKRGMPAMFWQHRSDQIPGIWEQAMETEKGLQLRGQILDTTLGNDVYKLAKAKAIKGLSVGYIPKQFELDQKKGVRKLLEVDLLEVSLVTFPANEKARITRVKNAHDNEREFEEFLREAGYSREAAKIITAKGFKALSGQREAEAEQVQTLRDIAHMFNQITA